MCFFQEICFFRQDGINGPPGGVRRQSSKIFVSSVLAGLIGRQNVTGQSGSWLPPRGTPLLIGRTAKAQTFLKESRRFWRVILV
jgi:hypothetical protein